MITFLWIHHIEDMALELWHLPVWFMCWSKLTAPHVAGRLSDRSIERAARERANELRQLVGVPPLAACVEPAPDPGVPVRCGVRGLGK